MSELCPVAVPLEVLNEAEAETATEAFLSFLETNRSCDVTFVFENSTDKIEAHQCFLRARSPVFDSMFRGFGPGSSMREVKVEDASPLIVNKFLQFIYADKFDVTTAQALHLLQLGHRSNVQLLVTKCQALICEGISTENAIEIYETAEKYGLIDLKAKAADVVARSLKGFLQDPKLMTVKDTTLIALLKRNDLTVTETALFQLAVKWGKHNSRGNHELAVTLTEILPHIRFTSMTPDEFTTVVWPTKLIPLEETANIYAYILGDDSTRAAILPSLKFETSCRQVAAEPKFETVVTFIKELPEWPATREGTGSAPYKECISFSTTVSALRGKEQSFQIHSVSVKWPARQVQGVPSKQRKLRIHFRVLIMSKHSSCEHYTTEFSTVIRKCVGTCEIAMDPPVKIHDGFDYCIAVEDEYPDPIAMYTWEPEIKYTYYSDPVKISQNLQGETISHQGTILDVQSPKRNDCPAACATSRSYNGVYTIRSICITKRN